MATKTTSTTTTTTKVAKQPLPGRQTGTKNSPAGVKTSARSASQSAEAKLKREQELAEAKAEKERKQQEAAEARVKKQQEIEARKAERERIKAERDAEPKVNDIALEISTALATVPEKFVASQTSEVMSDAAKFLISAIDDNMATMDDAQIMETYRVTTDTETAVWITRTKLAENIHGRIKAKVADAWKNGDTKKSDSAVQKALNEVCKAVGVGPAVFMYDVRMASKMFDAAYDNLEGISSTEMVEAAKLLKHRSYFTLAVDCELPRAFIRELVAVVNNGEKLTVAIATQIKHRMNAKAQGKAYEPTKSAQVEYLVKVKDGEYPSAQQEFICGVHTCIQRSKENGKDYFLGIVDGQVWIGDSVPPVSKGKHYCQYTMFKADGTVITGIGMVEGVEMKLVKSQPKETTEENGG